MERNLQKEQQAMKELMGSGQYKLDAQGKNADLEKAVRQKTYGSSRPTFKKQYGLDQLEKQIDEATGQHEQRVANQGNRANYYEKQLREKMPWLGADRQKLQKKYANIKDPFAREKVINKGMDLGRASLGEIMNRMMGVYQSRTAEQEANLKGMERKYNRALEKYQQDKAENERMDALDAQQAQMQMRYGGGGGSRRSGGGRRGGGGRYGGGRYSRGGSEQAGGSDAELSALEEKVKNREITREEYGRMLEAQGAGNYDDLMAKIYEVLPDEALAPIEQKADVAQPEQQQHGFAMTPTWGEMSVGERAGRTASAGARGLGRYAKFQANVSPFTSKGRETARRGMSTAGNLGKSFLREFIKGTRG